MDEVTIDEIYFKKVVPEIERQTQAQRDIAKHLDHISGLALFWTVLQVFSFFLNLVLR